MLLDYLQGQRNVELEVESTTLEMSTMSGEVMFRDFAAMDKLEHQGLEACIGPVLDVGGGSGCHSLWLQERGLEVDTLDVSPGCVEVMRRRGVRQVMHENFFVYDRRNRYATILMLMNGVGICGTVDGLQYLLGQAQLLLAKGGQIIADSTDLARLCKGAQKRWHAGGYIGETEFTMHYRDIVSDPFSWLYIDFYTMQAVTEYHGMRCERLLACPDGRYLMRIF